MKTSEWNQKGNRRDQMVLLPALLCFLFAVSATLTHADPEPPKQPASGPGGKSYEHKNVLRYKYGSGADQFWVFTPAKPKPGTAPVVLFVHGWGGFKPFWYASWIEHIVKKGHILIYPRYQGSIFTLPKHFTPNTIKAFRNSVKKLKEKHKISPDLKKFAVVGHSAGGTIAANIAALSAEKDFIPEPDALMVVQPGRSFGKKGMDFIEDMFPLKDLSNIPGTTRMIVTVGEEDNVVGNRTGKNIYLNATSVPAGRKNYIVVRSDRHGEPDLIADHFSPLSVKPGGAKDSPARDLLGRTFTGANAIDYYGYWKLLDGLLQGAFEGKNLHYALGNTEQQKNMGTWGDGQAVNKLTVKSIETGKDEKQGGKESKNNGKEKKDRKKDVW